jgi:hypothetical protein
VEIARTFHRYKNSILKFNPRSYLELEGGKVNAAIRKSILVEGKNEFALYNNGITMLSDETNLNEKIGQRNRAQLNVRNPQIINGGQTAYTLSRIYEETPEHEREALFAGKELLLKVITLSREGQTGTKSKVDLIEAISIATNQQTVVITADRYSNEEFNVELQNRLFARYGLLFERKRGEFQDGVYQQYIGPKDILERNLFFRVYLAANGKFKRAVEKRIFARAMAANEKPPSDAELDRFYFAFLCLKNLGSDDQLALRKNKILCAKLYAMTSWYKPLDADDFPDAVARATELFPERWLRFAKDAKAAFRGVVGAGRGPKGVGGVERQLSVSGWFRSQDFLEAVALESDRGKGDVPEKNI